MTEDIRLEPAQRHGHRRAEGNRALLVGVCAAFALVVGLAAAAQPGRRMAPQASGAPPKKYDTASCDGCHAALISKKFKHSALKGGGTCADCHVPADRPTECEGAVGPGWSLKAPDPDLCGSCHDKSGDTPMHPIIALGGCTVCHDAHGSDVKRNLRRPKEELCLTCHLRPDQGRVVHTAVKDGACVGCHEPHSGVVPPLLREEKADLCAECHESDDLSPEQHQDAKKGCLDCHAAHSSNTEGLLRDKVPFKEPPLDADIPSATYDNKPCLGCHQALMGKKYRHGIFKGGTCGDCHLPTDVEGDCKGPVEKGWRLKRRQPGLCMKCHDKSGDTPMHHIIYLRGCTACHDAHSGDIKRMLKAPGAALCRTCHRPKDNRKVTHTAVKEGLCIGCHEPHSGVEAPLLRDERKALCDECHEREDVAKGPVVHTPVAERRCLDCHDPHGGEQERNLKAAPGSPLCLSCHDAKKPYPPVLPGRRLDLTRGVVHQAIPRQGCEACHETGHSGSLRLMLKKAPPRLCNECHQRKDDRPYVHGAVRLGDCPVCHAPHSAENRLLLRQGTTAKLCFQCHADDLSGRAFVHRPVGEGKCTLCHDPHGAGSPANLKLLSRYGGCLDCHYREEEPEVPHAALERYGCVACHDPHGTANPFQLLKPVNQLCTGCHEKQTDGFHATAMVPGGHVVTNSFDARRGREFSCASCHNPHGSNSLKLFYYGTTVNDMCEGCHGDRIGKHPELVDVTRIRRASHVDAGFVPSMSPTMLTRPDAGEMPPEPGTPDAGTPDAGTPDAGTPDAGTPDAGTNVAAVVPKPAGLARPAGTAIPARPR